MLTFIRDFGLFGMLQMIISICLLIFSIKKAIELYILKNNQVKAEMGNSINAILFWSALIAVIGFLGAFIGSYPALQSIMIAGSYDPRVLAGGVLMLLNIVILGLTAGTFFSIVWFILWSRYNKLLNVQM